MGEADLVRIAKSSVYRGSLEGDEPTGEYSPAPKLVCTTHSSAKSIIIALVHVPISFKFLIDPVARPGPGLTRDEAVPLAFKWAV